MRGVKKPIKQNPRGLPRVFRERCLEALSGNRRSLLQLSSHKYKRPQYERAASRTQLSLVVVRGQPVTERDLAINQAAISHINQGPSASNRSRWPPRG